MNLMLASGGYPWTVIPVEQRDAYMATLEEVSVQQNIVPFTGFIANLVEAGFQEICPPENNQYKGGSRLDLLKVKADS